MDEEEKELMAAVSRDEWKSVSDLERQKEKEMEAAWNSLKSDRRMNSRFSGKDYRQIQIKAAEGVKPYQTLAAGIVHEYLNSYVSSK